MKLNNDPVNPFRVHTLYYSIRYSKIELAERRATPDVKPTGAQHIAMAIATWLNRWVSVLKKDRLLWDQKDQRNGISTCTCISVQMYMYVLWRLFYWYSHEFIHL